MKRALPILTALAVVVGMVAGSGAGMATGGNSITSPDTTGDVGRHSSLALDSSGKPVVSYFDNTNLDLKVIHCDDPNCEGDESGNTTSPDTAGDVGRDISLVLDDLGNPVVSYEDTTNHDLKVMHCNDENCAGGDESIESPDTEGDVGGHTSLALDDLGNPVVSYYYYTDDDLKVLHCDDPNCAGDESGNISSPDTEGDVGRHSSLALDSSGNPVVSYYDYAPNYDLKVMHCDDPNCEGDESGNTTSPDTAGDVGGHTSLALDDLGNPVVSYYDDTNDNLKVLHCDDPDCAGDESGNISSPDTEGDVGADTSMVLDASGNPVVAYYGRTNGDLKVLHCNDPNCSGGDESITSPDTEGDVGEYPWLVLDSSGNPVVSYFDRTNLDLKLLHCGNPNCAEAPVGGVAEDLPARGEISGGESDSSVGESESSARTYAALAGGVAAAVLALGAGAWYARRRWVR